MIEDPGERARMKILSDLMSALVEHIRAAGWTQKEAAKVLGVTQPRVSDLMRGKIDLFSVDAVVVMLLRVGYQIDWNIRQAA